MLREVMFVGSLTRTTFVRFDCACLSIRYKHHLSPEIIKDPWSKEEDLAIVAGQAQIGNKWTEM